MPRDSKPSERTDPFASTREQQSEEDEEDY
jgi:hypothetical protein